MANSTNRMFYFFLGTSFGATTATLLAPRSGRDTRNLIAGKTKEGIDTAAARTRQVVEKASSAGRDLQNRAGDWIDRGRQAVSDKRQELSDAVELGRQAYQDEKERLQRTME